LNKPLVDVKYEFRERTDALPGILERFERERLKPLKPPAMGHSR
jgi:hypothetical protein